MIAAPLAASSFLERAVQPVLVLIQVAPFVAYISSVVLWLGAGDPPVLFMTALVCLPAFVFAAVAGMRSADPASRELFASVDASPLGGAVAPAAAVGAARRCSPPRATTSAWRSIVAYLVEGSNFADEGLGAIGKRAAGRQRRRRRVGDGVLHGRCSARSG